jgi:patatin-like phospholipase/acyl hydrolase
MAGSTSAVPTYFASKLLSNKGINFGYQIDGGIFMNNPELVAIYLAHELNKDLVKEDIVLISLGTGLLRITTYPQNLINAGAIGWLTKGNLIDIMIHTTQRSDAEIEAHHSNSCLLQPILGKNIGHLDDASSSNLLALTQLVQGYISDIA